VTPSTSTLEAPASPGNGNIPVEFLDAAYNELRRVAQWYLRQERPDHTLQPTALVHEAYLRLVGQDLTTWHSREHFIGVAATMMRRILVNHAVRRSRRRHGGGVVKLPVEAMEDIAVAGDPDLIRLDDTLTRMAAEFPLASQIVELKFFGGLSNAETARVLEISQRTVERNWQFGRAWLFRELSGE